METVYCTTCNRQLHVYRYRLKKTKSFYCTECYKIERKKILLKYNSLGNKAALLKIKEQGLTEKQMKALESGRYKEKKMTGYGCVENVIFTTTRKERNAIKQKLCNTMKT